MALFCDFENVALGMRDAKYDAFDIQKSQHPLSHPNPGVPRPAMTDMCVMAR